MVKIQLWENKTLFQENDGLENPIGLLLESTFDNFKYLKENTTPNVDIKMMKSVVDAMGEQ